MRMQNTVLLFLIFLLHTVVPAQNKPGSLQGHSAKGSEQCFLKKLNSNNVQLPEKAAMRHSFDVLDYKLELDLYACFISPYAKTFSGNVIVTFRVDSALSAISLNATATSLQIDSVRGAGTVFSISGNLLNITLARAYAPGETASVRIYYKHKNVSDGAFYVSNGMVFTDCEPEGARSWFPCWDRPSDKATINLRAKVPATVKLGSNGRLADSTKNGDTIYYNWISRDPVATYLVVMSGKVNYGLDVVYWKKPSNPADSIPIRFYYNAGENISAPKGYIGTMTTHYSNLFGEHPFEKNGFATLNNQFTWGGMENQTLTSLCPGCWDEGIVSHEFAHQWFGDMITCATWADIFLNEGFATFTEALWIERSGGYASYKSEINSNASSYLSSNPGWAISNPDWAVTTPNTNTLFNFAITYAKGACVLHMLRYVLGDSTFFRGMKAYAQDPNFKYNAATIADFKDKMGAVANTDLTWFFDQWTLKPNHPLYANKYYITAAGTNNWTVGFQACQTQSNPAFFKMPVEINIKFAAGADTLIRVMNNSNNEWFTFYFNRQPTAVQFDPNNQIVLKTASLISVPPVPVELISFTGSMLEGKIALAWQTATELNNHGFEVERSLAGSNLWQVCGFVKGAGTTTTRHEYTFADVPSVKAEYVYRLKQIDFDGKYEYSDFVNVLFDPAPAFFALGQNYPNPFNPSTTISYQVSQRSLVRVQVFTASGEEVASLVNEVKEPGFYSVQFTPPALGLPASGVYLCKMTAGRFSAARKMILVK